MVQRDPIGMHPMMLAKLFGSPGMARQVAVQQSPWHMPQMPSIVDPRLAFSRPTGPVPRRSGMENVSPAGAFRGIPRPNVPAMPTMPYSAGAIGAEMWKGLTAPFNWLQREADRGQRPNEPHLNYQFQRGFTAPIRLPQEALKGAIAGAAPIGQAIGQLFSTPENDAQRIFNAMVKQESGGQQFDKNGRPLTSKAGAIGIAQVMPGTAPEAAKLAGLPWDPQRYRTDPEYNKALGFAYFQQQLRNNNGDVAKAVAAYNAGPGGLQRAVGRGGENWQAFLPGETQNYLSKVAQNMGLAAQAFGAPAPGFNAQPYQNAMAAQDQAAALLQKPISATFTEAPLPERPKPTEFAMPDFSKGDAAFAATAPKNPFDDPRERRKVQWSGWAKGIGQALAGMSGNEGIGTMLMKVGGMALQGRAIADEKIMAREDEFEQRMAEYNRALASRNDTQAAAAANVLNQNIQLRNQHADQIWADNVQKIQKDNPQIVGDRLVTRTRDPNDPNKVTMTSVPISNTIAAEAILNKANIGLQMGQAQAESNRFAYTSQQTTARTALGYTVQMAQAQGNGQAATEGYGIEAASRIRSVIQNGTWTNMFPGAPELDTLARSRAYQTLGVQMRPDGSAPMMPLSGSDLKAFQEQYEDALTGVLYEYAAKAGTIPKLFTSPTAQRAYEQSRARNARGSTRVDSRGRTSTSMSWEAE